MVKLLNSFRALKPIKACVVGDFVVDTYITGSVGRISPEAPVPILHAKERKDHPGMAGNVALNLLSLGAEVMVCGRVGADPEGKKLIGDLKKEGVDTSCLLVEKKYNTPIKQRIIAQAQQLLRVDFEDITPLSTALEEQFLELLPEKLQGVDVIALSDYKKGFLTQRVIQRLIQWSLEQRIPLIVDPKGDNFSEYKGCTLIKPNLQEAYVAAKLSRLESLDKVAQVLLETTRAEYLLITKSEAGMSLFHAEGTREDFTVESQEVKDVTGAGDTVLAMVTMGMGNHLTPAICAELGNIAASVAIQKMGCVRVTLSQVAERLLLLDHTNKVFAEEHLFALNQILLSRTFSILALDKNQGMTTALFHAIKKLASKAAQHKLILYLAHTKQREALISLLASLQEVDFILLCSKSLSQLCTKLYPKQAFFMSEDKLQEIKSPVQLLTGLTLQKVI